MVAAVPVNPAIGYENMKIVASVRKKDDRAEVEQEFLEGKGPVSVREMMRQKAMGCKPAGEEDKKEWFYDCFLSWGCSESDIKEGANLIFNMLCNAPFSEIRRFSRRQRVPNTYNNGYHYETVYAPERRAKIDF